MNLIHKLKHAYVRYNLRRKDQAAIMKFDIYHGMQKIKKSIELMLHPNDEWMSTYVEIDYSKCPLRSMRREYNQLTKKYSEKAAA